MGLRVSAGRPSRMSRHLIQDSLFDLVDQRTRSTTPEECAEFLDLLFGWSRPALRRP